MIFSFRFRLVMFYRRRIRPWLFPWTNGIDLLADKFQCLQDSMIDRVSESQERMSGLGVEVANIRLGVNEWTTAVDDRLDKLTAQVGDLAGYISTNRQDIGSARIEMQSERARIGDLWDKAEGIDSHYAERVTKLGRLIDEQRTRVDELKAGLDNVRRDVAGSAGDVAAEKVRVADVKASVSDLTGALNRLRSEAAQKATESTRRHNRYTDRLTDTERAIEQVKHDVAVLGERVDDQKTQIVAVNESAVQKDIKTLYGAVDNIQAEMAVIGDRTRKTASVVKDHDTCLNAASDDLATIDGGGEVAGYLGDISTKLANLESRLDRESGVDANDKERLIRRIDQLEVDVNEILNGTTCSQVSTVTKIDDVRNKVIGQSATVRQLSKDVREGLTKRVKKLEADYRELAEELAKIDGGRRGTTSVVKDHDIRLARVECASEVVDVKLRERIDQIEATIRANFDVVKGEAIRLSGVEEEVERLSDEEDRRVDALAADVQKHHGRIMVLADRLNDLTESLQPIRRSLTRILNGYNVAHVSLQKEVDDLAAAVGDRLSTVEAKVADPKPAVYGSARSRSPYDASVRRGPCPEVKRMPYGCFEVTESDVRSALKSPSAADYANVTEKDGAFILDEIPGFDPPVPSAPADKETVEVAAERPYGDEYWTTVSGSNDCRTWKVEGPKDDPVKIEITRPGIDRVITVPDAIAYLTRAAAAMKKRMVQNPRRSEMYLALKERSEELKVGATEATAATEADGPRPKLNCIASSPVAGNPPKPTGEGRRGTFMPANPEASLGPRVIEVTPDDFPQGDRPSPMIYPSPDPAGPIISAYGTTSEGKPAPAPPADTGSRPVDLTDCDPGI